MKSINTIKTYLSKCILVVLIIQNSSAHAACPDWINSLTNRLQRKETKVINQEMLGSHKLFSKELLNASQANNQLLLFTIHVFEGSGRLMGFVRNVLKYKDFGSHVIGSYKEDGIMTASYYFLIDYFYNRMLRHFIPFYSPPIPTPTSKIYDKISKIGFEALTTEDKQILKKYLLSDHFKNRSNFIKKWPKLYKSRIYLGHASISFQAISAIMVLNYLYQRNKDGEVIDLETYKTSPEYIPGEFQVQILNETTPFPHTALRIGNMVYSYGQTNLSAMPYNKYLLSRTSIEILKQRGFIAEQDETFTEKVTDFIFTASGLKDAKRSIQVININLTKDQYRKLKMNFAKKTQSRYLNNLGVNTCSTQMFREVENVLGKSLVSRFTDPSPAQSQSILAFKKSYFNDDKTIGKMFTVSIDKTENKKLQDARNTYINMIESKVVISLFAYFQVQRAYLELTKDEKDLTFIEEGTQQLIKQWKQEELQRLLSDTQLNLVDLKVQQNLNNNIKEDLSEYINDVYDPLIKKVEEEYIDSTDSDFEAINRGMIYKDLLERKKYILLEKQK